MRDDDVADFEWWEATSARLRIRRVAGANDDKFVFAFESRNVRGSEIPNARSHHAQTGDFVGSVVPAKQTAPAGQMLHPSLLCSLASLLNVPPGHGKTATAPSTQYDPAGHAKHSDWPLAFMKLPAAHLAHAPEPMVLATEPGLHSSGAPDPSGHAWPTGQVVQSACATSPGAPPYVPSAHAAALALTLPASQ